MAETKFILVVEDDPILKNLLGHTFAGRYQTLYASDGNEALSLFEQYKPALVLLDLMLPTMDGFAVLQNIRARTDEAKSVPVIVVSNLGQEKDRERAIGLGATSYLVKVEVSVEEIVTKIEATLMASGNTLSTTATDTPPTVPPASEAASNTPPQA